MAVFWVILRTFHPEIVPASLDPKPSSLLSSFFECRELPEKDLDGKEDVFGQKIVDNPRYTKGTISLESD